ncbi:MAG: excinuclease ABC subunit UvrB [Candidatus Doudnabacteria bacterium]|nr:excinuclease ABC subunit UvrB [Candidatus Doudnabacteria bacterium]
MSNTSPFNLVSEFEPTGDQPGVIEKLTTWLQEDNQHQTLLGVTGSGKTFTMANVIANIGKPTLVMAHNKTLAAQLASEFRQFFPDNAVSYFVSYYDYYLPESYNPKADQYIAKETQINEEIERLRHAATRSLFERDDVIVVASVSAIYGLGNPNEYFQMRTQLKKGSDYALDKLFSDLISLQYTRNDIDFKRGTFRVRGDTVEIFPIYEEEVVRLSFFGNTLEDITRIDSLTGEILGKLDALNVYPASHYAAERDHVAKIVPNIKKELQERVKWFKDRNLLLEAQRIEERVKYDIEMLESIGMVSGIENYSVYTDGRKPGEAPFTLVDYFPDDFVLMVDESHMTIPQIGGMYAGDRARKENLVQHGFRLPSAFDNRPLTFEEFEKRAGRTLYVSATPKDYELKKSKEHVAEQIIRPTGLLDPEVEIRPTEHQIDDVLEEVKKRIAKEQRVLITTLTKRMSEELTEYLDELGIKVAYIHSDVDTLERLEILQDLRKGEYDVLVGINLLREGLDLPEVTLVLILDADKEGFLRSDTALIQTMGRAARHAEGHVILYADNTTDSMKRALRETTRRRKIQMEYNKAHGITPTSVKKEIREDRLSGEKRPDTVSPLILRPGMTDEELHEHIEALEGQMELAAQNLEFEEAARLRDEIAALKNADASTGKTASR